MRSRRASRSPRPTRSCEAAGALAREFPDAYVQTHLERKRRRDRLTQGAVSRGAATISTSTSGSVCSGRDRCSAIAFISRTGKSRRSRAIAASPRSARRPICFSARACSTSAGSTAAGVRVALATDVGGGTSYSMLADRQRGLQGAANERPVAGRRCRPSIN